MKIADIWVKIPIESKRFELDVNVYTVTDEDDENYWHSDCDAIPKKDFDDYFDGSDFYDVAKVGRAFMVDSDSDPIIEKEIGIMKKMCLAQLEKLVDEIRQGCKA